MAATTQGPAETPVTLVPDTVQTDVVDELNVTGNPALDVALSDPVPPTVSVGAAPKVMVWLPAATVNERGSWGAAV